MQITLEQLEAKLLEKHLKIMFKQAYEQGIKDAQEKYAYPKMLRKKDIAEMFQVSLSTVEKIIRMEGFPKSEIISARYPRDQVIEWANQHVERVHYLDVSV